MVSSPFPVRGLKGLWWELGAYRPWPALLGEAGYNVLILCYTSCAGLGLTWRSPLDPGELDEIRRLGSDCDARGVELWLAIHPFIAGQGWTPEAAAVPLHPTVRRGWFPRYWQDRRPGEALEPDPPLRYGDPADLDRLAEQCRLARQAGIRTIVLCLDDIEPGPAPPGFDSLAEAQLWLVGGLRAALRSVDPAARLLVVPTYYWTAGARAHPEYTAVLARGLPPEVDLFWTGEEVRSHAITAAQAREATELFGRPPIVWLNYASNDSFRFALQLPPAHPPAADLASETAGLLVNPMRQSALTRLHALVLGEYLADPIVYRHDDAVRRATVRLVGSDAAPALARVLDAWAAYPDPRSLTQDLRRGGRAFLEPLTVRVRAAREALDDALPRLARPDIEEPIRPKLAAGFERLGLLLAALELRLAESEAAGNAAGARSSLLARLTAVDEETASDARAVLGAEP